MANPDRQADPFSERIGKIPSVCSPSNHTGAREAITISSLASPHAPATNLSKRHMVTPTLARSSRAADLTAPPGGSPLVLVVENDAECASSLADLLEFCGYRVTVATSARQALQLVAEQPDVIISELRLPDMDGYDLIRDLRQRAGTRPLLVIAVSSREREANQSAAKVDRYFRKPADPRELLTAVARFCRTPASTV